ncbi:4Fe-4S binding protein [Campylobacter jejuni]|nr:4Fe-4S binding protein [Campylobacter jejuni]MCW1320178.1 4Fe-4S binding protein [Campylobacter jejuni]
MKIKWGIVAIDDSMCIDCKACAIACPYGTPQFNHESGHMSKCDGCYERLKEGKNPICVDSCPFRALKAGYNKTERRTWKFSLYYTFT